MSSLRTLGLALVLGCAGSAHAACNGPQALTERMRLHPTAENAAALGNWFASHQQFACAVDTFRAGLKAQPQSAQLHYLTGLSLLALKRPDEASREMKASVDLDPTALKPHIVLASLCEEADQPQDAEREWRKALAIDPHSEAALDGLTGLFMNRQDYASVIQLLANAPRTEKLTIALSRALGLLNDLNGAADVLNEALKENPDSVPLNQALIVVLVKQLKHEEAIKLTQSLIARHPANLDLQVELLRLLALSDHLEEARDVAPKLLAARPNDPEVLFLSGLVQRANGDIPGARDLLEKAVALEPDFGNFQFELGNTLVQLKQWAEARDHLQKAIALGADQAEVHLALGQALRGLGQTDQARQEMTTYQQMKHEGELRLEAAEAIAQGDQELDAGKFTEAEAHYREAIEDRPQNANYRFKLAIAFNRAGDVAAERKALEEAVQLDPHLPGPQNALGYLLSRNGDADGAVAHFRAAVEAAPGWTDAWINLAAELAVTSHFSEARRAVAKALELDPNNAQAKELRDQLARDPAAQQQRP